MADVELPLVGEAGSSVGAVPEAVLRKAVAEHYDIAESVVRTIYRQVWSSALASQADALSNVEHNRSEWQRVAEKNTRLLGDEITRLRVENATAVKLLEYALLLRMYGERAPGGDETWRQFDHDCELFLRARLGELPQAEGENRDKTAS